VNRSAVRRVTISTSSSRIARTHDTTPAGDRPRERLAALGPAALANSELVALLLRTGSSNRSALDLAAAVLAAARGLEGLALASVAELEGHPGLGPAKAATVAAAIELGRRAAGRPLARGEALRGPADVYHHFAARLRDEPCERFLAVLLDGRHRVLGEVTVSQGTLTASLVHPREVFRPAIRQAAAAIVLVHNHPSGDPTPSAEDRNVTRRLQDAGELVGIRVVDHVVIGAGGFHSFDEAGDLGRDPKCFPPPAS